MTDEAIICEFMDPLHGEVFRGEEKDFHHPWWSWYTHGGPESHIPILTSCPLLERLGRLHEVEARLTAEQWRKYEHAILTRSALGCAEDKHYRARVFLHATPAQKIAALAQVLRGETR